MKRIILIISFLSIFMSASSFASVGSAGLQDRLNMMMTVAEESNGSPATQKMIVVRVISSLATSNIEDDELLYKADKMIKEMKELLNGQEKRVINANLEKLGLDIIK